MDFQTLSICHTAVSLSLRQLIAIVSVGVVGFFVIKIGKNCPYGNIASIGEQEKRLIKFGMKQHR